MQAVVYVANVTEIPDGNGDPQELSLQLLSDISQGGPALDIRFSVDPSDRSLWTMGQRYSLTLQEETT